MKQKEFFDLAEEMEKECGDWENSEGMSKCAYDRLVAKVEQMDAAESEEHGKVTKHPRFKMKKRYLVVLAAALVLLMGTGVVGDRAWISDSNNLERESEVTTKVDNEDKTDILREEEEIYQEIADKLGIAPMWLGYTPEGMVLDSYVIMEDTGWAYVNYIYNEKVISLQMAKDNIESSGNVQWDGISYELKDVSNECGYEDLIEAYCIDKENHNYGANISYGNGYYNIAGFFESEKEFLEILNGIYFKTM